MDDVTSVFSKPVFEMLKTVQSSFSLPDHFLHGAGLTSRSHLDATISSHNIIFSTLMRLMVVRVGNVRGLGHAESQESHDIVLFHAGFPLPLLKSDFRSSALLFTKGSASCTVTGCLITRTLFSHLCIVISTCFGNFNCSSLGDSKLSFVHKLARCALARVSSLCLPCFQMTRSSPQLSLTLSSTVVPKTYVLP